MNDLKSFRTLIGLLAAAWLVVGIAISAALIQTGAIGNNLGMATVGGIVLGAIGLIGTWLLRKWGPILYLAANLLLVIKPWIFGVAVDAGGIGWGYWLLLVMFIALVAANWNRFRD